MSRPHMRTRVAMRTEPRTLPDQPTDNEISPSIKSEGEDDDGDPSAEHVDSMSPFVNTEADDDEGKPLDFDWCTEQIARRDAMADDNNKASDSECNYDASPLVKMHEDGDGAYDVDIEPGDHAADGLCPLAQPEDEESGVNIGLAGQAVGNVIPSLFREDEYGDVNIRPVKRARVSTIASAANEEERATGSTKPRPKKRRKATASGSASTRTTAPSYDERMGKVMDKEVWFYKSRAALELENVDSQRRWLQLADIIVGQDGVVAGVACSRCKRKTSTDDESHQCLVYSAEARAAQGKRAVTRCAWCLHDNRAGCNARVAAVEDGDSSEANRDRDNNRDSEGKVEDCSSCAGLRTQVAGLRATVEQLLERVAALEEQ